SSLLLSPSNISDDMLPPFTEDDIELSFCICFVQAHSRQPKNKKAKMFIMYFFMLSLPKVIYVETARQSPHA
ncbi:MAG: hypothetical protein PUB27_07490, partial [Firmicutes bacterium]|nr:hypothetical protein [Bacillota bacterium]